MSFASDRGQSNTFAVAIVLTLALAGALLITGVGSVTLEETKQIAETQSGVRTMTELDSRASLVALDGGDATSIDVSSRAGSGRVTVESGGEIRFVLRNASANTTVWEQNHSLGAVVYENGNQQLTYQGGGVWRRTASANGSVMVSPPEVHYRQGTLTLPMISVTGTGNPVSTARIRKVGQDRIYPVPTKNRNYNNPVPQGHELVLYVQSDYYRGWARFFEGRFRGNVTVFDHNRTVRVELVAPTERFAVDSGLISVGTGAPIDMKGSGGAPTFVDSYDSSRGNYSATKSGNGTVRSPGGLSLGGNTFVKGTVNTGGTLSFSGSNNTIFGDAWHQGISNPQNGNITGQNAANGTGVTIPPIDSTVNQRVNELCSGGDDVQDDGDTLNASGDGQFCQGGDLDLNGETLTINVSKGNVSLAVDGDIKLNSDATIEVVGVQGNNHTAEVWLGGDEVKIISSNVTVHNQSAPAFRLFAGSTTTVDIRGSGGGGPPKFVGLLYAPSTPGAGGDLSMQSGAELFGSAVVGEVSMQSGSVVHYDQALGGFTFERQDTPASQLSYLYVTVHEIRVEDD